MSTRDRPTSSSIPQVLPPPPDIPPRRSNPRTSVPTLSLIETDNATSSLPSKDVRPKASLIKANSMYTKDSSLICSVSRNKDRMSLPSDRTISSSYHPDLQGLDFSNLGSSDETFSSSESDLLPRSSSVEDLKENEKSAYPDIRHAFNEISGTQQRPSLYQASFMNKSNQFYNFNFTSPNPGVATPPMAGIHQSHSQNVQMGYGPPNLSMMNPFYPVTNIIPNQSSFTCSPHNSIALQKSPSNSELSFHFQSSVTSHTNSPIMNIPIHNQQGLASTSAFNGNNLNDLRYVPNNAVTMKTDSYVPNIQRVSSTGGFDVRKESSLSPIENSLNNPMAVAGLDEAGALLPLNLPVSDEDLICLGPPNSEHEYLSLDFFDPLYHKARKESIIGHGSHERRMSTASTFSFGEAFPNVNGPDTSESDIIDENLVDSESSRAENVLESSDFEFFDFNSHKEESSEEIIKAQLTVPKSQPSTAASLKKNLEKPPRPPSVTTVKGEKYEHLRKRTFIDPESESFCQMVTDLKCQYLSTDEKTNFGYLINQIQENHMGSLQVKLVVHSSFSNEPVIFTCDTNTLVDHVISHVLYTISPTNPQSETDQYILKVFSRTEYLVNDLPLAKFEYTHSCLKLDRDIHLELVSCQEVCRPFIKTTDDDDQILYFPREYIRAEGTAITQNALTILLETFYKEVDVLLNQINQENLENVKIQSVEQTVKAICLNLAKIETTEITKALAQLKDATVEFNNPSMNSQRMFEKNTSWDKEAENAIKVAVRYTFKEDIEMWIGKLIEAVKALLRMYCHTFLTDFIIGSALESPNDNVEVVKLRDGFIVGMASAHHIPISWRGKFDEYQLVCSLFHGTKKLRADVSTTSKPLTSYLCEAIVWDEWLQFENIFLCTLPRETRLCIMLCGLRNTPGGSDKNTSKGDNSLKKRMILPLCAAAIQLYDEKGFLHQGPQLVPLVMGASSDPIMPSCKTLLPDSVLLQVNLPDFEKNIFFPPPVTSEVHIHQFSQLSSEIQSVLTNIMEKESWAALNTEELKVLWGHRHYLTDKPTLLPRVLHASHSWDWASLAEVYGLMRHWKAPHPMQAFELLLPQFPDIRVREFATQCLSRIPTDDLICFLPQMIQALKFESYHNSPLAKLLLEQACKSPRFAHQLFWLLKGVASQETTFKRRYELMFVALANVAGDATYHELKKQEELVKIMTSLAEKVKTAKDKESTLKRELLSLHEMLEKRGRVLLPYNPSMEVIGLDMKACSYFASNAFPLKLVFKNSNPKADSHYSIFKVGDDLRQDMLTMQLVTIMDSLWLQNGLDLRMITFACLATGPKRGLIELITESNTLRKIQVSAGVTGSFKDRPIKEWLQKHNSTELEYKTAVENFTHSCAGYCVATYVLGVCDRHNDNIMLKQSGHMFHIDFSKFLGDSQMFGNFKRDRVPFVLTSDMAYVINDGAKQGGKFQDFVDLCCQAFNILRQHSHLFRSLFVLMTRSGIPNVTEQAVSYIENALLPKQTDAQATATFTRMIEESMKSVATQLNFFIHNLAQLKFSSHNEGELLSFVSKTYTKETDGQIRLVELTDYQKRYTPDKHYIFILRIERELQKVPTYIFRHFSEFVEFRDRLNETFSLVTWPNFSTRVVIGRSNVRSVAESRKMEISNFLKYLWTKANEITECDLVYTFFHPLLRDEQEAVKAHPTNITKLNEPIGHRVNANVNSGIQGQIKLSIQYKKDTLQIMIMHIRGLKEEPELPSPYVKIYLLPDPEKQTKQKSKIVKNTSHPTYNELLQYPVPPQEKNYRVVQVTVWNHDVLKENNFLGAVYIRLRDLDLKKDNTAWYPLGCFQMESRGATGPV